MSQHAVTDLRRELEKSRQALIAAQTHLAAHAEANAALHLAATVMYSPLHAQVTTAIGQIEQALERTAEEPGEQQRVHKLLAVLTDLDRCAHGRHEGDVCGSCGGASAGNPHMPTGAVVGYDISRKPIVMPNRDAKHDAAAWRAEC